MTPLKKNHKHSNKSRVVSKTLKHILVMGFMLNMALLCAQQLAYVTADSGLTIRAYPDISSKKTGLLYYGDEIEITEHTNNTLVVLDEGKKITGKWVKIKTPSKWGYVFNAYLSKERIAASIEIKYTGLDIRMKNLKSDNEFKVHSFFDKDVVNISVAVDDSPEGKTLVVKNKNYKTIHIFQRFENSVSILNEGPHCNLTEWEHYNSEWIPLKRSGKNRFQTLTFTKKDKERFIDISIEDLKSEVLKHCGEDWLKYIENVKTVSDYPASVTTSRMFLKIILTDFDDKTIEKSITFEIPMGC